LKGFFVDGGGEEATRLKVFLYSAAENTRLFAIPTQKEEQETRARVGKRGIDHPGR
jgi:hypothetical protein